MWDLIQSCFQSIMNSLVNDYLTGFETMIGSLFSSTFHIESLPGLDTTVLSTEIVNTTTTALYGFMVVLLALKLIWKGFSVYILWRDGDAENSPGEMLLGAVFAMIVAIAFPLLYDICVDVVMEISSVTMSFLGFSSHYAQGSNWLLDVINTFQGNSDCGWALALLSIVYIIVLIVLIFKLLAQGVELLIYRLGVPFAVVGLVNSDGGAWKPYIQMLFKQAATILVQYYCVVVGTRVISSLTLTSIVVGIAFELGAFAAPKLMAQFMAPSGGGGLAQKAHTIAMVVRTFGG